tara:strand:- start:296 stop:733 length:438 start_codon:yes stop_codon:yes gene_type:complete
MIMSTLKGINGYNSMNKTTTAKDAHRVKVQKIYKHNNRSVIAEYQKDYKQNNKTVIAEYQKAYRLQHKNELITKQRTVHLCDLCNATYTHSGRSQHMKSVRHMKHIVKTSTHSNRYYGLNVEQHTHKENARANTSKREPVMVSFY